MNVVNTESYDGIELNLLYATHRLQKDCKVKRHVRTNTGENAYKCQLCNTQNSHLEKIARKYRITTTQA